MVAGDAAVLCVAGMALGDIHLGFAWQTWRVTSALVLRCRRGTCGIGLALVARAWARAWARLVAGDAAAWFRVAGVALAALRWLAVTHTHNFVTHHLSHTHTHTTLSQTICHTQLCHTPSVTHNFFTGYLSHHYMTDRQHHTAAETNTPQQKQKVIIQSLGSKRSRRDPGMFWHVLACFA